MGRRRDDRKRNQRLEFWQKWERQRHPLICLGCKRRIETEPCVCDT